jgi:hypothetical protein
VPQNLPPTPAYAPLQQNFRANTPGNLTAVHHPVTGPPARVAPEPLCAPQVARDGFPGAMTSSGRDGSRQEAAGAHNGRSPCPGAVTGVPPRCDAPSPVGFGRHERHQGAKRGILGSGGVRPAPCGAATPARAARAPPLGAGRLPREPGFRGQNTGIPGTPGRGQPDMHCSAPVCGHRVRVSSPGSSAERGHGCRKPASGHKPDIGKAYIWNLGAVNFSRDSVPPGV